MQYKHYLSAVALLVASNTYAGEAVWTFEALTATKVSLPRNSTTTVQYRVTNQSSKTHVLAMKPMIGVTQTTEETGSCSSPFTLAGGASCLLTLEVNGSQLQGNLTTGPDVCISGSALQCYRPSAANSLNITVTNALTVASIAALNAPLDLFVKGPISSLRIKNTSTNLTATKLRVNFAGTPLEGRVESVSSTCQSVAPQAVCQLKFKPIAPVTLNFSPIPLGIKTASVTVESEDGSSTEEEIEATEYQVGDEYQGGIIGCLSETDDLQNLIVAEADESIRIRWGEAGSVTGAQSNTDGASNTEEIINSLGDNSYAAKECSDFVNAYEDWFLPAKNQLNCLYNNKAAINSFSEAVYWNSTESVDFPTHFAWSQNFSGGNQFAEEKEDGNHVRCVRALSYD